MCRKLYFRFVFYAVRTDLRIMKKKGEKSSQSDWLSTSMSPAAYLCRRYSTDVCSRAFAALGRAHAVPCYGQDCLHLPTDDLPSCSPCDPIRQRTILHLRAVSMPYRHRHLRHPSAKARSPDKTKDPPHIVQKVFSVLASIYCPGPLPAKYRRHE